MNPVSKATDTVSAGANPDTVAVTLEPGGPELGVNSRSGVTVNVAFALNPLVAPTAVTVERPPGSEGGTMPVVVHAPLASATQAASNTPANEMLTVSPAPNPDTVATNGEPGGPELGLNPRTLVSVNVALAVNPLVAPSALTVWAPSVPAGTVIVASHVPFRLVVHWPWNTPP